MQMKGSGDASVNEEGKKIHGNQSRSETAQEWNETVCDSLDPI